MTSAQHMQPQLPVGPFASIIMMNSSNTSSSKMGSSADAVDASPATALQAVAGMALDESAAMVMPRRASICPSSARHNLQVDVDICDSSKPAAYDSPTSSASTGTAVAAVAAGSLSPGVQSTYSTADLPSSISGKTDQQHYGSSHVQAISSQHPTSSHHTICSNGGCSHSSHDDVMISSSTQADLCDDDVINADPGTPSSQQLSRATATGPDESNLGYNHVDCWHFLWTKSVYAIKAARQLQPGQLVSAVAGLNSLTMKKRMILTLKAVSHAHTVCNWASGVRPASVAGSLFLCSAELPVSLLLALCSSCHPLLEML